MNMRGETYTDDNGREVEVYSDNVLVLMKHHEPGEVRSAGGIYIPQQARSPKHRAEGVEATVIAAGPGWYPGSRCACGQANVTECGVFEPSGVTKGDRVVVESKDIGDVVTIGGVEHRMIRASQILAVVESEAA